MIGDLGIISEGEVQDRSPRFAVDVRCCAKTVAAKLAEHIADTDPPLEGHFDPAHCVLRVTEDRRYIWSPELDLTFDELDCGGEAGEGVRVRFLFTPRPAVWTAFAFVYSVIAVAGLAGGLFAAAQLSLGRSPWALWVPVAAAVHSSEPVLPAETFQAIYQKTDSSDVPKTQLECPVPRWRVSPAGSSR